MSKRNLPKRGECPGSGGAITEAGRLAERIQLLGGISLAMAADVAEATHLERPSRGREEVPRQISRLLDANQNIIAGVREAAKQCDEGNVGSNDLLVRKDLRLNELQVWFLAEHLVALPVVEAG